MSSRVVRWFGLIVLGFIGFACPGQMAGRLASQRIPVPGSQAIWLEVLMDARLTDSLQRQMWGIGDWDDVVDSANSLYRDFKIRPPLRAVVRLVDSGGHVRQADTLSQPLARISEAGLLPSRRLYFLTVDHSLGAPAYDGPITSLLEVRDWRMDWVQYTSGKKNHLLELKAFFKAAWEVIPSATNRRQFDLLQVESYPKGVDKYVTRCSRYYFDGWRWQVVSAEMRGWWDVTAAFPAIKCFPPVPGPTRSRNSRQAVK